MGYSYGHETAAPTAAPASKYAPGYILSKGSNHDD
jgi:hypothetical protein